MKKKTLTPQHRSPQTPAKGKTLAGHSVGRPKISLPDGETVTRLAMLGHTDKEMAQFFGVSEKTFNTWKATPEFLQSIKKGKEVADCEVVKSLFKSAVGSITPDGDYVPPSVPAQIFWLKNRKSQAWKDKQDVEVKADINVSTALEAGLARLRKAGE